MSNRVKHQTEQGEVALKPYGYWPSLAPRTPQQAEIVLGQPKARCRYHGICRIDSPGMPGPKGCLGSKVQGILSWDTLSHCKLTIPKRQLVSKLELYHFGGGEILLHRKQSLAPFWTSGGKHKFIAAGTYTVYSVPGHYAIQLVVR